MAKIRKIHLDTDEIDKTISVLKDMQNDLRKISTDIESILNEAVSYCVSQSGNFIANTYWQKTEKGYRIIQEGEGVLYVEFGTGAKGAASPHPMHDQLGMDPYNSGPTIFTTKDGRTGWFYPLDDTRREWRFTEGQPARMQMYKTARWLEERLGTQVKLTVRKAENKW